MKINPLEVDPEVKALFDQMLSLMGSDYTSMMSSVAHDGAGSTLTLQCIEAGTNNSINVSKRLNGVRISVSPVGANLGPSETVQFTPSAFNPDGSPVAGAQFVWAMTSGVGSVTPAGLYTAPSSVAAPATDTLRCSLNGSNAWTSVLVSLHT